MVSDSNPITAEAIFLVHNNVANLFKEKMPTYPKLLSKQDYEMTIMKCFKEACYNNHTELIKLLIPEVDGILIEDNLPNEIKIICDDTFDHMAKTNTSVALYMYLNIDYLRRYYKYLYASIEANNMTLFKYMLDFSDYYLEDGQDLMEHLFSNGECQMLDYCLSKHPKLISAMIHKQSDDGNYHNYYEDIIYYCDKNQVEMLDVCIKHAKDFDQDEFFKALCYNLYSNSNYPAGNADNYPIFVNRLVQLKFDFSKNIQSNYDIILRTDHVETFKCLVQMNIIQIPLHSQETIMGFIRYNATRILKYLFETEYPATAITPNIFDYACKMAIHFEQADILRFLIKLCTTYKLLSNKNMNDMMISNRIPVMPPKKLT